MSITEKLKNVENKFAWTLLGILLTVVSLIFGLYPIFHQRNPAISFEITNEVNVLDLRKPLRDLTISFRGEDIEQRNLNLRIFTIRIENSGQVNILQSHYELDDIWGFEVHNGKVIETRLVDSNSDYLKSKLNPQLFKENIIQLKKIIFERGKFFTLEVLVLHNKDNLPEIIPIGKIAGIDRTVAVKSWLEKGKQTFIVKVFSGSIFVHIVRLFIYLSMVIVLFAVILFLEEKYEDLRYNIKKKSLMKKIMPILEKQTPEEINKMKIVVGMYLKQGPKFLKRIEMFLKEPDKFLLEIQKYSSIIKESGKELLELEKIKRNITEPYNVAFPSHFAFPKSLIIRELLEKGVLNIKNEKEIQIDQQFKNALDRFLEYLEQKNEQEVAEERS